MTQPLSPPPEPAATEAGDTDASDTNDGGQTAAAASAQSALVVFLLGEGFALVLYMFISRHMWFFLDEWDFLAARTSGNLGDLFRAHNEHWVTLPVLAYRALWWVFGIRSYRPYQFVMIVLHLGAALLVRTVMRRAGVRPWTATLVASVLVFFGSGYQNIVLPFQMTLVGSLVFGLVDLLLATHDAPTGRRPIGRNDGWGLAAGCAALMCSGVGVPMVVTVGVAVLMTRGWRLALFHTAPLGALYLTWYAAIGHRGFTGYRASVRAVVTFVRSITTSTFSAFGHYRPVGILLAAILVVGLFVAWRSLDWRTWHREAALPLALIVGALALLCITGLGRAGLAQFKERSRYLDLAIAMLLPAMGVAVDAIMKRWRVLSPALVILLLVGIPGNINVIVDYMNRSVITHQTEYQRMMLALPRMSVATQVPRDIVPEPQNAHFVTIGWLLDGAATGRVPKPHTIAPDDAAMDPLRLSFRQIKGEKRGPSDHCITMHIARVFHLKTGQRILVAAPSGTARITPIGNDATDAYPLLVITVSGSALQAVRPVDFQIQSVGSNPGRVCAPLRILRATLAAPS